MLQRAEECPLRNTNKLTFPVQIMISTLSPSNCLKSVLLTLITRTHTYRQEESECNLKVWTGRGSERTQTSRWPMSPWPSAISFHWLALLSQDQQDRLTPQPKIYSNFQGLTHTPEKALCVVWAKESPCYPLGLFLMYSYVNVLNNLLNVPGYILTK